MPRILLFLLLAALGEAATAQQAVPLANPAAVWSSSCTYCHDHGIGPRLQGAHLPPALIASVVRSGLRAMPAFHPSEISALQLRELSLWVNRQPAVKSAADGKLK